MLNTVRSALCRASQPLQSQHMALVMEGFQAPCVAMPTSSSVELRCNTRVYCCAIVPQAGARNGKVNIYSIR